MKSLEALNLYAYADNSPAVLTDPTGLDALYHTRWAGVGFLHSGFTAEIDTPSGPTWYSVDGMFIAFPDGQLDMRITYSKGEPNLLPLSFKEETPISTDPKKIRQIIRNAIILSHNLNTHHTPYNPVPDVFNYGSTSNQVYGTLTRSIGIPHKWFEYLTIPGSGRHLPVEIWPKGAAESQVAGTMEEVRLEEVAKILSALPCQHRTCRFRRCHGLILLEITEMEVRHSLMFMLR